MDVTYYINLVQSYEQWCNVSFLVDQKLDVLLHFESSGEV